jgi:putative addiction module component (TIGR02574 family)
MRELRMSKPAIDIDKLSPDERLRLMERLWDSLNDQDVPLTVEQRTELDRRLDELDAEGPLMVDRRSHDETQ